MDAQQIHVTPPKSHRFLLLDALRGIAALFVVVFHSPVTMTSSFAANGLLAVDFFFCLSGLVIAFSYENRLSEALSLKDFAVARLIRLYPLYFLGSLLGLVTGIAAERFVFHTVPSWSAWLPSVGLALLLWPTRLSPFVVNDNFPLNGPAWSLYFEVLANLAYAFLIKLRIARNAVIFCIVAVSLAVLVNAVIGGKTLDVGARQADFSLGFARVSLSFFLGVLICRFYRFRQRKTINSRIHRLAPVIITSFLIGIFASPFTWMHTESFRLFAITLCFPAIVYCGAITRLPQSFTKLSTVLGESSYPLYLIHTPFVLLLHARRLGALTAAHGALVHGFVLCAIVLLAFVSWQIGERVDLPIRRALTRRYNAHKHARLTPISSQASTADVPTAQHDEA